MRFVTTATLKGMMHPAKSLALAVVGGLALVAGGCGDQKLASSDLRIVTRAETVDASRALVALPPGGPPIVSVTQRNYDNAVSQIITLATRGRTPGENALYVAFLTAADLPDGDGVEGNLLKEPSIEDFALAREMEERLPGVAMVPSATFVQNRYGPFSYAFGRGAGGEACIYVWQRIMRGDSLWRPKSGAISIRLRVCDPAKTEMSLLRLAYDYSINATLGRVGWGPIDDAPEASAKLGAAGSPIYPVPQASYPEALEDAPAPHRARAPARSRAVSRPSEAVEAPVVDRALEGFPTVPPPPSR